MPDITPDINKLKEKRKNDKLLEIVKDGRDIEIKYTALEALRENIKASLNDEKTSFRFEKEAAKLLGALIDIASDTDMPEFRLKLLLSVKEPLEIVLKRWSGVVSAHLKDLFDEKFKDIDAFHLQIQKDRKIIDGYSSALSLVGANALKDTSTRAERNLYLNLESYIVKVAVMLSIIPYQTDTVISLLQTATGETNIKKELAAILGKEGFEEFLDSTPKIENLIYLVLSHYEDGLTVTINKAE